MVLAGRDDGIDKEFRAQLRIIGVEHLGPNAMVRIVTAKQADVSPGYDKAAIGQHGKRRLGLVTRGDGVDEKLGARWSSIDIEDLRLDRRPGGVGTAGTAIVPGHHKAAIVQPGNGGFVLMAGGR